MAERRAKGIYEFLHSALAINLEQRQGSVIGKWLGTHAHHIFTAESRRIKGRSQAAPEAGGLESSVPTKDCWGAGTVDTWLRRGCNPHRNPRAHIAESERDIERRGRGCNRSSRVDFSVTDNDGGGGRGPRWKSTCPVA